MGRGTTSNEAGCVVTLCVVAPSGSWCFSLCTTREGGDSIDGGCYQWLPRGR